MKIDWIKFCGSYGDSYYEVGKNGIQDLYIEDCSTEAHCERKQLRMVCDGELEKVRKLDGSTYGYQKSKTE
jgi:hypothetical protein